jgi:Ca-activated chloride channel family protein
VATRLQLLTLLLAGAMAVPQAPRFSSRTLAVRVDALVTDGHHNPVGGLTAGDFELRDEGVVQQIQLDSATAPISVVLTLDASGSIEGQRQRDVVAAGHALLDALRPGERAALTTFNDAVSRTPPPTDDLRVVRARLDALDPRGLTALHDGVYVALASTLGQSGRTLVVVCTDGYDTVSFLEPREVLEAARRSNAVVYGVTAAGMRRHSALQDIAEATGGRMLPVASSSALAPAFQSVLQEFRSRYVLSFSPAGVPSGGFHHLDVRVRRPGLRVSARAGYVGLDSPEPH